MSTTSSSQALVSCKPYKYSLFILLLSRTRVTQEIKVVFESVKGFSKDAFRQSIKGKLFIAKNNGISTKEMLTTEETIQYCNKGIPNVGVNLASGIVKCVKTPIKYFTPKDLTLQDIGLDLLVTGTNDPRIKAVVTFICIAQTSTFSVVDDDFSNCLVGVDKLLD